jgi:hypothetical protein
MQQIVLGCKFIPFDKIKSLRFGENCPSIGYYNFNTYSARGRFQLSQSLLDGRAELDDTVTEAYSFLYILWCIVI